MTFLTCTCATGVAGLELSSPAGTRNVVKWHRNSLKTAKCVNLELVIEALHCAGSAYGFLVQSDCSYRRAVTKVLAASESQLLVLPPGDTLQKWLLFWGSFC